MSSHINKPILLKYYDAHDASSQTFCRMYGSFIFLKKKKFPYFKKSLLYLEVQQFIHEYCIEGFRRLFGMELDYEPV